ncbi:MAG: hypothetical protein LJE95_10080 [Acidobacteria bacterium]|nr:hypothetical protein [Acidobacteriota bacterium]
MGRIRLSLTVILTVGALVSAPAYGQSIASHRWAVNVNGATGRLELSVGAGGTLTGTALGRSITGRLVGRHLVLSCQTERGVELWDGWVSSPSGNESEASLIAGTVTRPGEPYPLPWFATTVSADQAPRPAASPPPAEPRPLTQPPLIPSTALPPPSTTAAPTGATPQPATSGPILAGTWRTPDGPLEIRQDGARITIILPDREVPGRVVGPETVIAGFAPGCCKGTLKQGFRAITWSNGITWYR